MLLPITEILILIYDQNMNTFVLQGIVVSNKIVLLITDILQNAKALSVFTKNNFYLWIAFNYFAVMFRQYGVSMLLA